jgi:hypothetical protein
MSADGGHLGWRFGSLDIILKVDHLKTIHAMFALNWLQRIFFLNIFPIWSYVKTMSVDGGHLGWRFGSLDIILKVDHLKTIHAMFALNWLQRIFFLNIFPIWSYVKTMSVDGGHLGWRSGSQDITLKVDHLSTIHAMFALN